MKIPDRIYAYMAESRGRHALAKWGYTPAEGAVEYVRVESIPKQTPDGYAYRYATPFGGSAIEFSHGEERNGCHSIAAIPYFFGSERPIK